MYKLLRTILFFFPAEGVHHFSMKGLRILCGWGVLRRLISWGCRPEGNLERRLLGLNFRNGVGLGAGFDKNALYLRELEALGFGFVEIGTVTPRPQAGNAQPRLFRLPQDQALINRMGFNNDGVEVIAARLKAWKSDSKVTRGSAAGTPRMIVGGNLGKNKVTPNEEAWKDYELCFRVLYPWVDYFVVNVSSPNTPGLRELQDKAALRQILTNLQRVNAELSGVHGVSRPLLLKIAPDLNEQQLDDVVALALEIGLEGLVAANTTTSREGLVTSAERVTAIGGGFYAQFVSYIDPESVMGFQFSLLMALPAVIGGIGTLWGPLLGAVILIPLTELTRSFIGGSGRGVDLIVYGTLIVLIALARPQGLVGLFSRQKMAVAR